MAITPKCINGDTLYVTPMGTLRPCCWMPEQMCWNTFDIDPKWDMNFYNSLLESFVGIVTETRFAQPTGNLSEKTIHTIHCKRPFVLVAPPFTLQYMHKLGYKTFDKWWSEDYDTTTDHFKRMEKN